MESQRIMLDPQRRGAEVQEFESRLGSKIVGQDEAVSENSTVFRIFHRELVLLIVLCAITIPLFLFTRSMAARNRAMNVDVASTWYQLGQKQLEAGNIQEAIDFFRSAATNDHDNSRYTLALATALAAADHIEEARQALLHLRTSAPESGQINLNLARLSAKEGKTADAVRYYHNALYGLWAANQMVRQRRGVRTEFVRFLLAAGDTSQALSELLILSSDTPDQGEAHNEVGQLFLKAGDPQRALEQFTRTLRLNGKDAEALKGAGRAAFRVGDYSRARRYLSAAVANGDTSADALLETTKLVLSQDPLAFGLATEERIRRLAIDLNFASKELRACATKTQDDQTSEGILHPLEAELAQGMQKQYRPRDLRRDADGFRTGLNLIYRIESAAEQICHESSAFHSALLLIGRKRGVAEQ